ncbi:ATPase 2, plasma membrane-type, partial [Mucuna pruriens]
MALDKHIELGMIIDIDVIYPMQQHQYRSRIDNLLVFLIGMDVLCSDKTETLTLNKLSADTRQWSVV